MGNSKRERERDLRFQGSKAAIIHDSVDLNLPDCAAFTLPRSVAALEACSIEIVHHNIGLLEVATCTYLSPSFAINTWIGFIDFIYLKQYNKRRGPPVIFCAFECDHAKLTLHSERHKKMK